MKVACIGWAKTGTTSMGRMFEILGFKVAGWEVGKPYSLDCLNGNYEKALKIAEQYSGLEDTPWNLPNMYKILDERFQNIKFVLTLREPNSWLNSLIRWEKRGHSYKNRKLIKKKTYGYEDVFKYPEEYLNFFYNRNEEIIDYFAHRENKDFIIFNFWEGDGWEKLCKFLDKPVPNKEIPHENINKEFPDEME